MIYRVEIDVRGGRAFAINTSGWTTTDPAGAFKTHDVNKAKRLANALKRWKPNILLDHTIDKQGGGNEIDPDIPLHPKAMSTEPPPPFQHGVDCVKAKHDGTGYLHGENDDSPYDVDGARYCGRCHHAL